MTTRTPSRQMTGGGILRVAVLALLCLTLAAPTWAQIASREDISPDFSDLGHPNAATGGRVNGLAIDPSFPNRIYAASEWGGIYRSQNGGNTWARLDGHRPMATWDVMVDPNSTNRVYATSFYDGKSPALSQSGINVSVDNGVTWTRPASAKPPGGFCANSADETEMSAYGIDIDPSNSSKVYIGTSCGMAVSTTNGVNWSFVKPPVGGAQKIWDVLVNPSGSIVDTCGDAGHWAYNVAGGTWTQGSGLLSGRCSLASSPYDDQNLFAAAGFSIFETEDRFNWQQTRVNPRPQGRIPFVATNKRSFAPAGQSFDLWFGDVSLWRVSCDSAASPSCGSGNTPAWTGGYTFFSGAHDDMGDIAFDPTASNDACPVVMSSDGGVYVNTLVTDPFCHFPDDWDAPAITPHALWPMALSGADRSGLLDEDLYFGNQDNGMFGTLEAGATEPEWNNDACCVTPDSVAGDADGGTIVYSQCCFGSGRRTHVFQAGAGFAGRQQITQYPTGDSPERKYIDSLALWGDSSYVMVTKDVGNGLPPDGGVWITDDITAPNVTWTGLHTSPALPPTNEICGVKVATAGGVPTFFVQTGNCNADSSTDRLFKYTGSTPGGSWTELTVPMGGIGLFDVGANDPNQVVAVGFTASDAFPYLSTDGGSSWNALGLLRFKLNGNGDFPMKNGVGPTDFTTFDGYWQPSLVAIDPNDSQIMVAGGRDSGVFVSADGGTTWFDVDDPRTSNTSGTPHIPRPRFAYFDSESTAKSIYIGSQGRGVWRVELESNCPLNQSVSNTTLSGTETFSAADTLTVGPSVLVESSASPLFESGKTVDVGNGLTVDGELTVRIGITFCSASTPVQVESLPMRGGAGGPR